MKRRIAEVRMSKRLLLGILVLLLSNSKTGLAQKKTGFNLYGDLSGLKNGTDVYLILGEDTVGRTRSKGSKFEFSGDVLGGANYYFIYLDSNVNASNSNALWLENKQMKVTGHFNDLLHLKLEGSKSHMEYMEVMDIASKTTGEERENSFKKFVLTHPSSLYVPHLVLRCIPNYKEGELRTIYNSLSKEAKESYYGKELTREYEFQGLSPTSFSNSPVGKIIPNFKVKRLNGTLDSIHTFLKNNKFTLIDFWASWCAPCRASIPQIEDVYSKFHTKGFGVLGLSIDHSLTEWEDAVKEDNTPWEHISDNAVFAHKNIFGMKAIPGYILVDQEGKVIMIDYITAKTIGNTGFSGPSIIESLPKIMHDLLK